MLMTILCLIVLCALLTLICYLNTGTDLKNLKSYRNYSDEVQLIVRQRNELQGHIKEKKGKTVFFSNFILFGILLFLCGLLVKTNSFGKNFLYLTIMGQGINLFDLLILDMLWFRKSKRVRFSGTEDKDELYQGMKKHLSSFYKGILMYFLIAIIDGFILTAI